MLKLPHLTPEKLIGEKFASDTFGSTRIALVGYCPPPSVLKKFKPTKSEDQYFIHVSRDSVETFTHNGISFLSLFHIYGGPVSASTVEELAYFGIDYVLAYGLAGGLGTKGLRMGDYYLVESAFATDGTTPHYTKESVTKCDAFLKKKVMQHAIGTPLETIKAVRAITGDAIYQEHDGYLEKGRKKSCDIVNLDSAHLFAAAKHNNSRKKIKAIECGVISDVTLGKGKAWESTLSAVLTSKNNQTLNPLDLTGNIVEYYVKTLAPALL